MEWKDDLAAEVPPDVVSWLRGQYATHMGISKVLRRCISLGFGVGDPVSGDLRASASGRLLKPRWACTKGLV